MATTGKLTRQLTFEEKIAAFGGTDGKKYYAKQKKLKQEKENNLILTTRDSLKPLEDIWGQNGEFEDDLESRIEEEILENEFVDTLSPTISLRSIHSESTTSLSSFIDINLPEIDGDDDDYIEPEFYDNELLDNKNEKSVKKKKKKKQKKKMNKKKEKKLTVEIDYNDLFGNNYDDNGELIIGAITTPKKKATKPAVIDNGDGVDEYHDLFNFDDSMIGKITSKGFNDKKKKEKENEYEELFGNIGAIKTPKAEKNKNVNGKKGDKGNKMNANNNSLGMDMDDLFDVDSMVSDLDQYEQNMMNHGLPGYNEYNSDEFSSDNGSYTGSESGSYTNSYDSSYYSDDSHNDDILYEKPMKDDVQKMDENVDVLQDAVYSDIELTTDSEDSEIPQPRPSELEIAMKARKEILREIELDQVDNDEMKAFEDKRKMDMNDLLHGLFSDDQEDQHLNDIHQVEINENDNSGMKETKKKEMTLKQLLKRYNINTKGAIYDYYYNTLNIRIAKDLVDHLPTYITQPPQFKSTQTRMLLMKMSKFVMRKVLNGEWNGIKSKEWKELETNKVSYTFAPPQNISKKYNMNTKKRGNILRSQCVYFENKNGDKSNRLRMNGNMISFIDKKISVNMKCNMKIKIERLPHIDSSTGHGNIMLIGIVFCDINGNECDKLYISDRCAIYKNDGFLSMLSLSNCVMMETDSEIGINIDNNKQNKAKIIFSHHDKNGKLYKHNKREIVLDNLQKKK